MRPARSRLVAVAAAVVSLLASGAPAAQERDALAVTRALLEAGAAQLALDRVVRLQPQDRAAAAWASWEALRCRALDALGRHADLAARAPQWPSATPADALIPCFVSAAHASSALGRHAEARRLAARALWRTPLPADAVQALRRVTIASHVAERRGEQAYRAMLRYQQDHAPLPREVASQFVADLLALGMDEEALAWLPQLDEADPARLALRVRAGLMPAEAAAAQARAALAKGADPAAWRILVETLAGPEHAPLRLAVYERMLERRASTEAEIEADVRRLWDAYLAAALDTANRSRLLVGDDAGWGDYAGRRLGSEPALARALFAHLAQHAQAAAARHNAQLQLLHAYQADRLERAALRVFATVFPDADALDTQVRYRLGAMAEAAGAPAAALRYWRDLPAPADMAEAEWLLRLARQRWRAGDGDAGVEGLARHYAAQRALAPAALAQAVRYAEALLDAGRPAPARALLEALLVHAAPGDAAGLLAALGRAHEGLGEPLAAAEAYLRAALSAARGTDAAAVNARLRAGAALARAGYARDAHAQLEWVVRNAKDPAAAEAARRELARVRP